jgi:hypothetical protein
MANLIHGLCGRYPKLGKTRRCRRRQSGRLKKVADFIARLEKVGVADVLAVFGGLEGGLRTISSYRGADQQ